MEVKDATKIAIDFFKELPGEKYVIGPLTVEEIEKSYNQDEGVYIWYITLGYYVDVQALFGGLTLPTKNYKIFGINSQTGDVVSMKMRENKK